MRRPADRPLHDRRRLRTEYPGAAPEEMEALVARPIEESLGIVSGLVGLTSVSRAGTTDVVLEFTWGTDMDLAALDVREKLDQMQLPRDAKKPLLLRYDPSLDPMMRLALVGTMPEVALRRLADEEVKRELEGVPGVAAVVPRGGLEEEIRIRMNETALTLLGLDIGAVSQRLAQENLNLASGLLREGETEYLVRTLNEFRTVDEIGQLVIAERDGAPIRLAEVGTVTRDTKRQRLVTRVNGRRGVIIDLHREADANIVRLAEQIRTRLYGPGGSEDNIVAPAEPPAPAGRGRRGRVQESGATPPLALRLPTGVRVHVLTDQSGFIDRALSEVGWAALSGGALAVALLYLFLRNVATTAIIGLSIPLSIVATFAGMHLCGISMNLMSLGGIVLGIGMLVDNSIVVLESITYRRERGDDRFESAVRGTSEVFMAVTASTLTTVAVFLPIVFVEGVAGQIFRDLSLTVVLSLSASLVVALVFVPMLAALDASKVLARDGTPAPWKAPGAGAWGDIRGIFGGSRSKWVWLLLPYVAVRLPIQTALELVFTVIRACVAVLAWLTVRSVAVIGAGLRIALSPLLVLFGRFWDGCAERYPVLLRAALTHRVEALAVPVALFTAAWLWLPRLGRELMPPIHEGEFTCELACPVGTPIEATDRLVAKIETALQGEARIASFHTVVGADLT
ncbi:MAG: efflux RND transporter permease subunit, partial [Planctomycetes bacterium]|nr:efflux RND transporter permease subunit [Planctomycetota bacterium]